MKKGTISKHRLNATHVARHSAYVKSEFGRKFFPACVFRGGSGSM
jgi:hypothetical protein